MGHKNGGFAFSPSPDLKAEVGAVMLPDGICHLEGSRPQEPPEDVPLKSEHPVISGSNDLPKKMLQVEGVLLHLLNPPQIQANSSSSSRQEKTLGSTT